MKFKLLAGAALAAVFAASGASAQVNGLYGAVDLGWHSPEGIEASSSNNAPDGRPYNWTFDSEDSIVGFARLGYRINKNWRVELEGGYRPGELTSVRGDGARAPGAPVGLCNTSTLRTAAQPECRDPFGSIASITGMFNVIYDLNFSFFQQVVPFIGAGIGVNNVDVEVIGQFSNVPGTLTVGGTNPAFQNLVVNDNDVTVAWQAIAGLTFNATERLAMDLTYRYLSGSDISFDSRGSASLQPGTFSGPYEDQSITLGVRYAFMPPPPPPEPMAPEPVIVPPAPEPIPVPPPMVQPAPPPAPVQREFIVYFPFDQSILTPEAQTVVQEAASYAQQGAATRITVTGHADTSGSAAYNVRLSERRARAVADAMVGLGVNPGVVTADWRGESQPAVATGDGVKEPLNRRATIDINF